MKLTVRNCNEKYILSFGNVMQLCGCNMPVKTIILDSICKHFSSEKYKEYEEKYIDNIEIDGEIPGRKQWETYRINSKESIINCIQLNKSSILGKCIKEYSAGFDCQNELLQIDEILLRIFDRLNKLILSDGLIELQYTQEDLFGMIQQATVRTTDGRDIHELEIEDLLDVLLEIIVKQQEILPEKRLYIFENIDHLVSKQLYESFVERCAKFTRESSLWFIFSTSLDGFVYLAEDYFENINIIGDDIYSMPDFERIVAFIKEYYPVENKWNGEDIKKFLSRLIQNIAQKDVLLQPEELVLLKLINESNGIKENWENAPKTAEIQCLKALSVL